ncbi:hypothetical protein [Streptomyces sp. UNOC14_S4]|uniref:hypothetical protein n=1 Tax=Streptomyces sp. UNOC14_S4 TaxID=2872340 RepID=UPI001E2AA44C|nr:hypothetical protein [Streptomyces sp. UNOC14_S4]MCC3770898.1 hypothetical protein [Streptomyces sp. UNOC14_S4]
MTISDTMSSARTMSTGPHAPVRRPLTVPYITAWSGETRRTAAIIRNRAGTGITFLGGENVQDRDERGVLWTNRGLAPGKGTPQFGYVHSQRQRRCMRRWLCQVCGGPADHSVDGTLWLLDTAGVEGSFPQAVERTVQPPVCRRCAVEAPPLCPALRRSHALVRVRDHAVAGVYGHFYELCRSTGQVDSDREEYVYYGDPAQWWVLAGQLFAHLSGISRVPEDETARWREQGAPGIPEGAELGRHARSREGEARDES